MFQFMKLLGGINVLHLAKLQPTLNFKSTSPAFQKRKRDFRDYTRMKFHSCGFLYCYHGFLKLECVYILPLPYYW